MSNLNQTPMSGRVHIAIFGKRNSGKSSLINALTHQNTALVSDYAGTTTDPVYKAIEFYPIGPCVFIDTAGFDDVGELGEQRVQKTLEVLKKTDFAIIVASSEDEDFSLESEWIKKLEEKNTPFVVAINKSDLRDNSGYFAVKHKAIKISAKENKGLEKLRQAIINALPTDEYEISLTADFVEKGDHVLLVMPQDINAPKGRLILPQVQTIRDLLDNKAIVSCVTTDLFEDALKLYKSPPKLIITDSQVFKTVYDLCPKESVLTSFSVLLARYKGDIDEFIAGAQKLDTLREDDKILILEACTHNPLDADIGRIQIPNMLRKKIGENLRIDVMSGNNIPDDLSEYSLIIHCGACMFNRTYVLSRIAQAKSQGIPITNYGVFIAKATQILDKIKLK